ncbi:tyrosine-type recombinase/integrase [Paenibacillus sp. XY044]|uniref:tyrosine-type recombinase/integrase n=1 Tax=Paenibacillus sp. XY044 TaxID=2026089 RepID=UPI000B980BB6|nr:tyrosine-type recombinase/integrase [Paenibacillus sp. XY044]OZB96552.1 hypothetical protein CJP46_11790 [Paenibacillus sp. XY044]
MPLYDDVVSNDQMLEEAIVHLADQFGPQPFYQVLQRLDLVPLYSSIQKQMAQRIVLLEEAVAHYRNSDAYQALAAASQTAYGYELNMFIKYCVNKKGKNPNINDVSSATFLTDYLAPVKKANTRSKKSAFLRSFFGEVLEHFYGRNIEKLKRTLIIEADKDREPRAFTKTQINELLSLVRLGREAHRNFTILWTFLGTGVRLSELCTLQVGDIKVDRQVIMVRGKGKKGYKQPNKITTSSLKTLSSYISFRYKGLEAEVDYEDRYVFSDDKGATHLHESTVQKMFTALINEATTIPENDKKPYQFSIHSLRHSFALYLLESGVNIYTIKELMRHAWLSSTEVYLKLYDDMLVTAIEKHPLAQITITELF